MVTVMLCPFPGSAVTFFCYYVVGVPPLRRPVISLLAVSALPEDGYRAILLNQYRDVTESQVKYADRTTHRIDPPGGEIDPADSDDWVR